MKETQQRECKYRRASRRFLGFLLCAKYVNVIEHRSIIW